MPFDSQGFVVTINKLGGASRQVDAAMDAFERGDYDIAITLAGAAEGMLPELPGQPLFRMMRDNPRLPPKSIERHGSRRPRRWVHFGDG